MSIWIVLFPVFVQVALTLVLGFYLSFERRSVLRSGATPRDVELSCDGWPPRVRQIGNSYHNQFELPVLFYVAVILAKDTQSAGYMFVFLAWLFAALRLVHAMIHITSNDMRLRGLFFAAGFITLVVMWILLALRVFLNIP